MNPVRKGSGWEHLLVIARIEGLKRAYTWNPAVGCHGIGCEVKKRGVCWAEKFAKRFKIDFTPHLIPERLKDPYRLKKSAVITPVSMGDLFGLEPQHTEAILNVIRDCSWHKFAILTKLPQNALKFNPFPSNVWFGVSVNLQDDVWRLDCLKRVEAPRKYVLFEPLYSAINYDLSWLDLIVIGCQSYPTVQPKKEWVESILRNSGSAKVFFKSNLKPI